MQPAPPVPAPDQPRRLTPWEILARTGKVWLRNALPFTAVALVLDLPLAAIELRGSPRELDPRQGSLILFASWFVWLLTTAALSYGVLWHLAGKRPRALPMIASAARQLWPVFTVGAAYTALVMLGAFAMFLPGVFLLVAGYLAIPAAVADPGLGVEGALRRSLLLTSGHRLALLGVALTLGLGGFFGPYAVWLLLEKVVPVSKPVEVAVQVVTDAILSGFVCACPAVAFHALTVRSGAPAPIVRG
jgi:hypothetical protein